MELPAELQYGINMLGQKTPVRILSENRAVLSERYRTASKNGQPLLTHEDEAVAYAVYRMPATFGAVAAALEQVLSVSDICPKSLLDVGSGTGAVMWAADALINLDGICCLEREVVMRQIGKKLAEASLSNVVKNSVWLDFDLTAAVLPRSADLVTASYVLNELNEAEALSAALKMWHAADKILLIVEAGTPENYKRLQKIRTLLTNAGAYVIAPCPGEYKCPLNGADWCHFSCRVARSRLHKQLKGATMGYEDEKFTYLALSREPSAQPYARILSAPSRDKSGVSLKLCTEGSCIQQKISARDKDLSRMTKKLKWGDIFPVAQNLQKMLEK